MLNFLYMVGHHCLVCWAHLNRLLSIGLLSVWRMNSNLTLLEGDKDPVNYRITMISHILTKSKGTTKVF
jgi:hypothetical protein